LTTAFSFFAFWYLPYSATKCSFLTDEKKKIAFRRIQIDSSSVVDEPFNFREAVKILKHPTSWVILHRDLSGSTASISIAILACHNQATWL